MNVTRILMGMLLLSCCVAGCATTTAAKSSEVELLRAQLTDLRTAMQSTETTLRALEERLNAIVTEEQSSRAALEHLTQLQEEIRRQLLALMAQAQDASRQEPAEK